MPQIASRLTWTAIGRDPAIVHAQRGRLGYRFPVTFMSTLVAELAPTPGRVRATLRIVVASLVAVTFVMALHIEHGPYAFISIFVVSQPNAGASFRKGVLRLLGTMAGAA